MVADKKRTPKEDSPSEKKHDRHNENARAAASLQPEAPRISTDNL
ncbi:hypothetical protein ATG71_4590 [Bacillus sp. es.034]|nr:hypothetical protein ATG71_4590 [Bacillus sp. es.034]